MTSKWTLHLLGAGLMSMTLAACGGSDFSGNKQDKNTDGRGERNAHMQQQGANGGSGTGDTPRHDFTAASQGTEVDAGVDPNKKPIECTLPDDVQAKIDALIASRGTFSDSTGNEEGWAGTGDSCTESYYRVCVNRDGQERCGAYDVRPQGVQMRALQYAECLQFAASIGGTCPDSFRGI